MPQPSVVQLPMPASTGFVVHTTTYRPRATLRTHDHARASLSLVFAGSHRERIGESELVCTPLSVVFKTAEIAHSDHVGPAGVTGLFVELMPSTLDAFVKTVGNPGDACCFNGSHTWSLARRIRREVTVRRPCYEFAVEGLIYEILVAIGRERSTRMGEKLANEVRSYLHAHFQDALTLRDVAAQVGAHPANITSVFRAAFNSSPAAYVRTLRLEHARSALDTNRSLSEIALEAGFSDQSHFTRCFRRSFGVTPREYRLSNARFE